MLTTIREGLRSFAPRIWQTIGHEKNTGELLNILYAGPESQLPFIATKAFGNNGIERKYLGRRTVFVLDDLLHDFGASFAVLAAPRRYLSLLHRPNDVCVPWWIDCRFEIGKTLGSGKKRSLANDLRKVRNAELAYSMASTDEEFHRFYDRMYQPTIQAAFGEAALPSSREDRLKQLQSGQAELLFVEHAGDRVAGLTLDLRNRNLPVLRDMGVTDGNRDLLKLGAITATILFGLRHLEARGFHSASLGLSRCFLNDSVLAYKRKWQPTFEAPSADGFLFRISALNKASRGFFVANPCITEGRKGLRRTRFIVDQSHTTTTQLPNLNGIPSTVDYDISGSLPARTDAGLTASYA